MIDIHFWTTPNGYKVLLFAEEARIDYRLVPVNIGAGEQFSPEFLAISPNNRMPAIVDHDVDGDPVPVFESGAIALYLAEKTGQFMPAGALARKEVHEWLFWQVGNLGPMAGQLAHFRFYGPSGQDYALKRYAGEYERMLAVMERRLEGREYLVGDYSVADMIAFPWAFIAKSLGSNLDDFPNVAAWRGRIKTRPAVRRAIDLHKDQQNRGQHNADNNALLYNQNASHLLKRDS